MARIIELGQSPLEVADERGTTVEEIESQFQESDTRPYRDEDWLERQLDRYHTPGQVARWCDVTSETVRRWMDRYDVEYPGLPPVDALNAYLERRFEDVEATSKKAQMLALYERFGRFNPPLFAEVVDTDRTYATKVRRMAHSPSYDPADYRRSEPVPSHLRDEILRRDDETCVRCGSTESDELEIHHIEPGTSTPDNLVTLCYDCHLNWAHDGSYKGDLAHASSQEFWDDLERE